MKFVQQDSLNFWLTNTLPRRLATTLVGRFSRIENPLVCAVSLRVWQLFTELDLTEAEAEKFPSMHACFARRLKPGARPIDPDPAILASPSDAIVGACGTITDGQILQIKGFSYALADLLADPTHAETFSRGTYVTLRLTSAMYHRFHAPQDCRVTSVTHIPGDTFNVNPPTLARIPGLFCRNERAVIRTTLATGQPLTLVPVAAILVAGIKLNFLPLARDRTNRTYACDATLRKGEEIGWFEHGSTIIVLAPAGFVLHDTIRTGVVVRAGQALLTPA